MTGKTGVSKVVQERSSRTIRSASRFAVLRALLREQPLTRQELARATGLSLATVATIVTELLQAGIIHGETAANSVGRPFARLEITADHTCLIGVDVAETYVKAHAFDLSLELLGESTVQMDDQLSDPGYVVGMIKQAVDQALAVAGVPTDGVGGVGISFPGQVNPGTGISVFAPNWSWHEVKVRELVQQALDFEAPIHVDNPLKAIALAEMWLKSSDSQHFVTLNLGTGVGGAIVRDGSLVTGVANNAGEWGHSILVLDGRPCRCGRRGCAEAYVGAPGIKLTLTELSPDHPAAGLHQTEFMQALAEGVRAKEPVFVETFTRFAHQLGALLGNIVNISNPEEILLTGWVFQQLGDLLLPLLEEELKTAALPTSLAALQLDALSIGRHPVTVGMAIFALEEYLASLGLPSRVLTPESMQMTVRPKGTARV